MRVPLSADRKRLLKALAAVVLIAIAIASLLMMPAVLEPVPQIGQVAQALGGRPVYEFSFPETPTPALERPVSVLASGNRLYVVDSIAGLVRVYDEKGSERGVIGRGTLEVPVYIARDAARGLIYVSDRQKRALFAFTDDGSPAGSIVPRAAGATGSVQPTSWAPLGVDVADDGLVYVTDVSNRHRVLVLEFDGTIVREIGGSRAALAEGGVSVVLEYPNAVDVTPEEVWVSDSNNRRVVVFGRDGQFRRIVAIDGLARGIDFLPSVDGTATFVAIVDTLAQDISVMDTSGTVLGRFGGPGQSAGRLAFPNDVAVSPDGDRLYVADTGNKRIQVWDIVPNSDSEGLAATIGFADASARIPYIGIALAAFLVAVFLLVALLSQRRPPTSCDASEEDDALPDEEGSSW